MNNFLGADTTQIVMWVILGAFFVLMIVMTIIPQRKQRKRMQEMMSGLGVGDRIMTIGGFVGTIVETVNMGTASEGFVVNVGTEAAPVNVNIIKSAVRQKLDANAVVTTK